MTNFAEVKAEIESKLDALMLTPLFTDKPMIYHLDVAAMYEEHKAAGNDWGPSFALATEVYLGDHVAYAKVKTRFDNNAGWDDQLSESISTSRKERERRWHQ